MKILLSLTIFDVPFGQFGFRCQVSGVRMAPLTIGKREIESVAYCKGQTGRAIIQFCGVGFENGSDLCLAIYQLFFVTDT